MNRTNNMILKMVLVSILGKKVVEHVILPFLGILRVKELLKGSMK